VELAGTQITPQKQSTPHKIERPRRTFHCDESRDAADQGSNRDIVVERARRNVRLPQYLDDFVCSNSVTDNNRYCCLVQESQMTKNSLQQCSGYCLPRQHMFVDQWAFNRHCQAPSATAYHRAFIEDPDRAALEYTTVALRYSDQQTAQPTPVDCTKVVASVSMVRRAPDPRAGRSVSFPVADALSHQRRLWRAHHMLTARHVATDIVSNPTLTTPSQVRDYLARNWRGFSQSELYVAASIAFAVSGATSAELSSILAAIFDGESQSSSSVRLKGIRATKARANAFLNFYSRWRVRKTQVGPPSPGVAIPRVRHPQGPPSPGFTIPVSNRVVKIPGSPSSSCLIPSSICSFVRGFTCSNSGRNKPRKLFY
jgi:hypothetical protein